MTTYNQFAQDLIARLRQSNCNAIRVTQLADENKLTADDVIRSLWKPIHDYTLTRQRGDDDYGYLSLTNMLFDSRCTEPLSHYPPEVWGEYKLDYNIIPRETVYALLEVIRTRSAYTDFQLRCEKLKLPNDQAHWLQSAGLIEFYVPNDSKRKERLKKKPKDKYGIEIFLTDKGKKYFQQAQQQAKILH